MAGNSKCNISYSSTNISKHANCFCAVWTTVCLLAKVIVAFISQQDKRIRDNFTSKMQEKEKNEGRSFLKDCSVTFDELEIYSLHVLPSFYLRYFNVIFHENTRLKLIRLQYCGEFAQGQSRSVHQISLNLKLMMLRFIH